jgi:hypothetical protein
LRQGFRAWSDAGTRREGLADSITRFLNVAGRYTFAMAVQLYDGSCVMAVIMAKSTRSGSMSALAEGQPAFSSGTGRFTIGVTGRDGATWHVHLTATEARQFVDYLDEHT